MKCLIHDATRAFVVFALLTGQVSATDLSDLSSLELEEEYRTFLAAMPLQLENGGARIFKLKDGSLWIVSIGSTVAKPMSSSEALRRRTVSKSKAQANAVAEINGSEVKTTTIMTTSDKVTTPNGVETGTSQETLDETIIIAARGIIKNMPVVGTWMNQDETLFFTAIGKRLE